MITNHNIIKKIRDVLQNCEEFRSDADVQSIFVDPSISAFRSHIPNGNSIAQRVDLLIEYLNSKKLRDGSYVMPRFLHVLADRYDANDKRFADLHRLADVLEQFYDTPSVPPLPKPSLTKCYGETTVGILRITLKAEQMRGDVRFTHTGGPPVTDITCLFHPPVTIAINPQSIRLTRIAADETLQAAKITIGGVQAGQRIDLPVSLSYRQSNDLSVVRVSGVLPIDVR